MESMGLKSYKNNNKNYNNQRIIIFFYVYSGCDFRLNVYSHADSKKRILSLNKCSLNSVLRKLSLMT